MICPGREWNALGFRLGLLRESAFFKVLQGLFDLLWVFMTKGPYRTIGSWEGLPEINRKLRVRSAVCART